VQQTYYALHELNHVNEQMFANQAFSHATLQPQRLIAPWLDRAGRKKDLHGCVLSNVFHYIGYYE
jgi:hypothetical protein